MCRLIHDANEELSVAMLELELLLDRGSLDRDSRGSLESSLEACRRVAQIIRQVSCELGQSGHASQIPCARSGEPGCG